MKLRNRRRRKIVGILGLTKRRKRNWKGNNRKTNIYVRRRRKDTNKTANKSTLKKAYFLAIRNLPTQIDRHMILPAPFAPASFRA